MKTFLRTIALVLCFSAGSALLADTITSMTAPDANGKVSFIGTQREGWLTKATSGYVVEVSPAGGYNGTPHASDIDDFFGGTNSTWLSEGSLTGTGTNHWLSVSLVSGSWGTGPFTLNWGINPLFWQNYGRAVITMHVGNGGGTPDWFLWEVKPNELSGQIYYKKLSGGGGGVSNVFLWGSGTPTQVPEGGYTVLLLGLGLLGLGAARRLIS